MEETTTQFLARLKISNHNAEQQLVSAGYESLMTLKDAPPSTEHLNRYGFNDYQQNKILKEISSQTKANREIVVAPPEAKSQLVIFEETTKSAELEKIGKQLETLEENLNMNRRKEELKDLKQDHRISTLEQTEKFREMEKQMYDNILKEERARMESKLLEKSLELDLVRTKLDAKINLMECQLQTTQTASLEAAAAAKQRTAIRINTIQNEINTHKQRLAQLQIELEQHQAQRQQHHANRGGCHRGGRGHWHGHGHGHGGGRGHGRGFQLKSEMQQVSFIIAQLETELRTLI